MNRLKTYRDLKAGRIDLASAAVTFNISEKDLKFRISRHGNRLPNVLMVMDKIENSALSRSEAAAELEISDRHVNQLMNTWQVKKPLREYLVTRTASQVKWELRKKFAIEYIGDDCDLEAAAEGAGVSTRQMRRWVSDLLYKHFEMPFKDLKLVTRMRRQRLADEVEVAEGIELAKRNVLDTIAQGEKTIEQEAVDRVMARRSSKGRNVSK